MKVIRKKIKKEVIREYAIKCFDEWLSDCPCENTITKSSMNINEDKIIIEFAFMKAVEVD